MELVKPDAFLEPGCKARIQEWSFPESKCYILEDWLRSFSLRLNMTFSSHSNFCPRSISSVLCYCCSGLNAERGGCPGELLPYLSFSKPAATLNWEISKGQGGKECLINLTIDLHIFNVLCLLSNKGISMFSRWKYGVSFLTKVTWRLTSTWSLLYFYICNW